MSESIDSAISTRIADAVSLTTAARREFADAVSKLNRSRDEITQIIADLTSSRDEIDALLSTIPGGVSSSHTSVPFTEHLDGVSDLANENDAVEDGGTNTESREEAMASPEPPADAPVEDEDEGDAGDEEDTPEQPVEAISGADKKSATGTGRTARKSRKSSTADELPFEGEDVWTQKDTDVDSVLDSFL